MHLCRTTRKPPQQLRTLLAVPYKYQRPASHNLQTSSACISHHTFTSPALLHFCSKTRIQPSGILAETSSRSLTSPRRKTSPRFICIAHFSTQSSFYRTENMDSQPQNQQPLHEHEHALAIKYPARTDYSKDASAFQVPYIKQDAQEIASLVRSLEDGTKKKGGFSCKKTNFAVEDSPNNLTVTSWRMQEWDYKKPNLPTYARGLFTTKTSKGTPEIVIRGYDKFFNIDEVSETKWDNIFARTKGPYELTLKENGCIIFISGLEDDTLLVCSKHSTGARADVTLSHAKAGEDRLERQLARLGKTKQDLARELRKRNVTAVAELCDDSFEEHILAYAEDKAGLYLHGMNLNLPELETYPSPLVQKFAEDWGFIKTGLIVIDNLREVKAFLEEVAESGAHDGRDIEGFVIRCKMDKNRAWMFKYKFDEPYLMYRQWRECTKSIIAGKQPRYKKHIKITEEYLLYARKRLALDRDLAKAYNQNHGIIKLRNDFLEFKNIKGADAAKFEEMYGGGGNTEVTQDIILVPIATIGCGKTTIALALTHLFGWGHIQNDNITGPKRPPRFTKAILDELDQKPAVYADRNNAERRERKQLITDVKIQHANARLVALHFVHNDIEAIRNVTQERVFQRGDNHQTIQAASDMNKVRGIMEGFINRFEPCDAERDPDDGFDAVIDLDPAQGSRTNLEIVVNELHRLYPKFLPVVPTPQDLDAAIVAALDDKPELRHDRGGPGGGKHKEPRQPKQKPQYEQAKKKKPLEYVGVFVPATQVTSALEKAFANLPADKVRFFKQLQGTRRIQQQFHVTLMHRASSKENPALWEQYTRLQDSEADKTPDGKLGQVEVMLERVVYDDRIMAIVVRLVPMAGEGDNMEWKCVNRVAHVTVGTRDGSVKPRESNDLLERWLQVGSSPETGINDVAFEGKPLLHGVVKGVLAR
ncbi:tRNA ligase 1 [Rhypophila decipiens]|uniref:tRNA ligase 1 n=1 Tax=Rhypophila decipiens TaxID=261697 RepID=A0AAN7B4Q6_9PEZI|nr:tRNA ligase 1 [Rhypophila decipiens]